MSTTVLYKRMHWRCSVSCKIARRLTEKGNIDATTYDTGVVDCKTCFGEIEWMEDSDREEYNQHMRGLPAARLTPWHGVEWLPVECELEFEQ